MSEPQFNKLQKKYIEWRGDVVNDRFNDSVFCGDNKISIDDLPSVKTPDVIRAVFNRPVTDQLPKLLEQLIRLCYDKVLNGSLPVKSYEGVCALIPQLLKHQQLAAGKPTEILEVKEKELALKTPKERYDMMMDYLRRPSN